MLYNIIFGALNVGRYMCVCVCVFDCRRRLNTCHALIFDLQFKPPLIVKFHARVLFHSSCLIRACLSLWFLIVIMFILFLIMERCVCIFIAILKHFRVLGCWFIDVTPLICSSASETSEWGKVGQNFLKISYFLEKEKSDLRSQYFLFSY